MTTDPTTRPGAWCVILRGYDFCPPQIQAICTTEQAAIKIMRKIKRKSGMVLPWNGYCVHFLEFDSTIDWEKEQEKREHAKK